MRKELLKGLTPEQIELASRCKTDEELIALARAEGVQLTDEQLKEVNGGACVGEQPPRVEACPQCHAQVTGVYVETTPGDGKYHFTCLSCGHEWFVK